MLAAVGVGRVGGGWELGEGWVNDHPGYFLLNKGEEGVMGEWNLST